ncbi:nucleophile aminohydrolase [Scheffersomyces amazonensis]|uniref:nucleophile aminohydrolase n=1 Tax=Scheffersomyces amazonensis TaxID=1078765 RepID=UPI00315DED2A
MNNNGGRITIVHIGAGNHSVDKTVVYKKLIRRSLNINNSIVEVIKTIEGTKYTNTGYGSSLNLIGKVECDSSFIKVFDGVRNQGALGGINDSLYPILTTSKVYDRINEFYKDDESGLSRPLSLYYGSCHQLFSQKEKEKDIHPLISPECQTIYDSHKDRVFKNSGGSLSLSLSLQEISDTVGAIIIDNNNNNTQIFTSSGGNFFKLPGRIGCAGIVGCAIDFTIIDNIEISCMCSGNGEDIILMNLANYLVNNIMNESNDYGTNLINLIKTHSSKFSLNGTNDNDESIVYVGVVLLLNDKSTGNKMLVYCHSTQSFYFGYSNSNTGEYEVILSRLNNIDKYGKVYKTGEYKL